jgi:hypothetical protein
VKCIFETEMAGDMQSGGGVALGVPVLLPIPIVELHGLCSAYYCTMSAKERKSEVLDVLICFWPLYVHAQVA